jgi:hypothetical protein
MVRLYKCTTIRAFPPVIPKQYCGSTHACYVWRSLAASAAQKNFKPPHRYSSHSRSRLKRSPNQRGSGVGLVPVTPIASLGSYSFRLGMTSISYGDRRCEHFLSLGPPNRCRLRFGAPRWTCSNLLDLTGDDDLMINMSYSYASRNLS